MSKKQYNKTKCQIVENTVVELIPVLFVFRSRNDTSVHSRENIKLNELALKHQAASLLIVHENHTQRPRFQNYTKLSNAIYLV